MQAAVFYFLTVLIWGSTWFVIRFQLGDVPESVSLVYRFGLSAILLLPWCLFRRSTLRFSVSAHLGMAAQGACLFSTNYLLFYWCTALITSGLVAIIFSTVIIMNIVNGAVFRKSPVRPSVLIGALIGLSGITLVFWQEVVAASAVSPEQSADVIKGLLIGLVATYLASLGNILSAHNQSHGRPVLQTNAYGMAYGAALMTVYSLVADAPFVVDWSFTYISSLLYLSVFGSIIAFGAYLSLIGRIGADRAAYATVLFPLVALLISSLFEDYTWSLEAVAGVALVLLGNVIVIGKGLGERWLRRYKTT